jgi:hypothetical protein
MRTFTPESRHEEQVADERESMRRVAQATGASAAELRQLMQRLADIDRSGKSAGIVAQGNIAADRMDAGIRWLEPLNPTPDKKRYAREKFWSFILGASGPAASLTLQGLALRPNEPEDMHADLAAKARKILESWRRTSDPLFWTAVEGYVRQQGFPLETQACLMHCIATVFSGDAMKLSNEQGEQLAGLLTDTYCDALGTAATMPSSEIYRRLSEGLEATERETGLCRMLGRSDAAQIAITALVSAIGHGGSH